MEREANGRPSEDTFRLNKEQQAEIGDILLSARAVSRQMVSQAREQSDELLRNAQKRADEIVREAEEKAAAIVREAEEKAAALNREEKRAGPAMTAEMQEYMVRQVGDCFSKLRRQQLEAIDLINEQWRSFLSGLTVEEAMTAAAPPDEGISQKDIETRVNAIARELMDMNEK